MEKRESQLSELLKYYHDYRRSQLILLALLAAALVMALLSRALTVPFLAIAIFWYFQMLRPGRQLYADHFNLANLECTVCRKLAMSSLASDGPMPLTPDIMERAGLMPCGDEEHAPLLLWGIYGEKRDFRLSMCDATLPQVFRPAGTGRRRIHFNSGVWVHIDLPADTQLHYKLLDEFSVPYAIRTAWFSGSCSYETATIDEPELARRFLLYRPENTQQTPSAAVLKSLRALMEYTPGHVALGIHGSQLDLFIRGRFLARPVSTTTPPTREMLDFDPFPELAYIVRLAAAFEQPELIPETLS